MNTRFSTKDPLWTYWKKEFFHPSFEQNKDKFYYLWTFQIPQVYQEIMEKGIYRLSRELYLKYSPYDKKRYARMIQHSSISCEENNMPFWTWYNHLGNSMTPEIFFQNRIEMGRPDVVIMFLEVPKNETYLTNYDKWEHYLFYEKDSSLSALENQKEEDRLFSQIDKLQLGKDTIQAIIPEIRKEKIYFAGTLRNF